MNVYSLYFDEFKKLYEAAVDESITTSHFDGRMRERFGAKLKIADRDGMDQTINDANLETRLFKELSNGFIYGINKMDLMIDEGYGIRSGKISIVDKLGTHYPTLSVTDDNGKPYYGNEFVAVMRENTLVTVMLSDSNMSGQEINKRLMDHDRRSRGAGFTTAPVYYKIIHLEKPMVINLAGKKDVTIKDFPANEGKEMVFGPGREVTVISEKTGAKIKKIVRDYRFDKNSKTLTLMTTINGVNAKDVVYQIEDKNVIVTPKKDSLSNLDINKIAKLSPEKLEPENINPNTVEFKGTITEIGLYDSIGKPTYKYEGKDKAVPFIRIKVDSVHFDTN